MTAIIISLIIIFLTIPLESCLVTSTCRCPAQLFSSQNYHRAYDEQPVFREFYDRNLSKYELSEPIHNKDEKECFAGLTCLSEQTLLLVVEDPADTRIMTAPSNLLRPHCDGALWESIGERFYATCVDYPPCHCPLTLINGSNLFDYVDQIPNDSLQYPISPPSTTDDSCKKTIWCGVEDTLQTTIEDGLASQFPNPSTLSCDPNTQEWTMDGLVGVTFPQLSLYCINYNPPTCQCSYTPMTSSSIGESTNLTRYPTFAPDTFYSATGCVSEIKCRGAEKLLIWSGNLQYEATTSWVECADFLGRIIWKTTINGSAVTLNNGMTAVCVDYESQCACEHRLISKDNYQLAYQESAIFREYYDGTILKNHYEFYAPIATWQRGGCFTQLTCHGKMTLMIAYQGGMREAPSNILKTDCQGNSNLWNLLDLNEEIPTIYATCVDYPPIICECSLNTVTASNYFDYVDFVPDDYKSRPITTPNIIGDSCQKMLDCETGSFLALISDDFGYSTVPWLGGLNITCNNNNSGWELYLAEGQYYPNLTAICAIIDPPTCQCSYTPMTSSSIGDSTNLTRYPTFAPDTFYSATGCVSEIKCRGAEKLLIWSGNLQYEATTSWVECADFLGRIIWKTTINGSAVTLNNGMTAVCVDYESQCACEHRLISKDNYHLAYQESAIFREYYDGTILKNNYEFYAPIATWQRGGCFTQLTCHGNLTLMIAYQDAMREASSNILKTDCQGNSNLWNLLDLNEEIPTIYTTCVDYNNPSDDAGFG